MHDCESLECGSPELAYVCIHIVFSLKVITWTCVYKAGVNLVLLSCLDRFCGSVAHSATNGEELLICLLPLLIANPCRLPFLETAHTSPQRPFFLWIIRSDSRLKVANSWGTVSVSVPGSGRKRTEGKWLVSSSVYASSSPPTNVHRGNAFLPCEQFPIA